MTSSMMMPRSMSMMSGSGMESPMGTSAMPGMMSGAAGMCMVPRCEITMEKCAGGMKMTCSCDDEVAAATLQNMCKMMAGSLCSCCCMMNGMMMCQCNMCMCNVQCKDTKDGVMITCTNFDQACCDMIQACCDCLTQCMESGCMCCICMGGMPVCCCVKS